MGRAKTRAASRAGAGRHVAGCAPADAAGSLGPMPAAAKGAMRLGFRGAGGGGGGGAVRRRDQAGIAAGAVAAVDVLDQGECAVAYVRLKVASGATSRAADVRGQATARPVAPSVAAGLDAPRRTERWRAIPGIRAGQSAVWRATFSRIMGPASLPLATDLAPTLQQIGDAPAGESAWSSASHRRKLGVVRAAAIIRNGSASCRVGRVIGRATVHRNRQVRRVTVAGVGDNHT